VLFSFFLFFCKGITSVFQLSEELSVSIITYMCPKFQGEPVVSITTYVCPSS